MDHKRLVVLGAGVKGTCIAALASLRGMEVVLVERTEIAAGATSANHGRLHSGAASWRSDPSSLISHRSRASRLFLELLGLRETQKRALYVFDLEEEALAFRAKLDAAGVVLRPASRHALHDTWIDPGRAAAAFELEEYGFNPAAIAARLCATAVSTGGRLILSRAAEVRSDRHGVTVVADGGEEIRADFVVNALARWTASLRVSDELPRPALEWFRWRLLCAPAAVARPPGRVVVRSLADGRAASAIGHTGWTTLDTHETPVKRVDGPDPAGPDWRRFDPDDPVDRADHEATLQAFPGMGSAPYAAGEGVFVLFGVQARRLGSPPGSRNEVTIGGGRYLTAFGGQASTALADALDVMDELAKLGACRPRTEAIAVAELRAALSPEAAAPRQPMRWELQAI